MNVAAGATVFAGVSEQVPKHLVKPGGVAVEVNGFFRQRHRECLAMALTIPLRDFCGSR